jgi:hypothetical protein
VTTQRRSWHQPSPTPMLFGVAILVDLQKLPRTQLKNLYTGSKDAIPDFRRVIQDKYSEACRRYVARHQH